MRDRIRSLEALSRPLEPDEAARSELLGPVAAYAERFLEQLPVERAYVQPETDGSALGGSPIGEEPASVGELLDLLGREVDRPGINPASGGHLGYIPGGGLYPSALGDFLADVFNRYAGLFFASPGAVRLERTLVDWMARLVGYTGNYGGDLTSGGSIANLTAIISAREAHAVSARRIPDTCVYLTHQTHHCVDKALRIAGLGECHKRFVAMDGGHRMDPAALERAITDDTEAGLRPWLVVASAGSTDTGAVDPLEEIADVTARNRLWLHCDAAYGGFFLLCDEGREVLRALERCDSIVMDPHKGLFLPYGTGAVLVRNVEPMVQAHRYQVSYLQDAEGAAEEPSPADLSIELSRPFRGLRLWLPLKLCGLAPFRAALAEKIWLARYFHDALSREPGFEVGPAPDLSVVTYRYVPARGDTDEFNRRLVEAVQEDGKVFLSSTVIDGRFTLRLAVLHFRTHLDTIDYTLDLLRRKARELESAGRG
ncbi:MAG: pyridoxal phosphate-dependent decarboxylase family protein [Dehalococcoidia bacterium]